MWTEQLMEEELRWTNIWSFIEEVSEDRMTSDSVMFGNVSGRVEAKSES